MIETSGGFGEECVAESSGRGVSMMSSGDKEKGQNNVMKSNDQTAIDPRDGIKADQTRGEGVLTRNGVCVRQ